MMLWELFAVYFQIGLFCFGGGYAAMPLIQSLIVEQRGWLTMAEYSDLVTIAEMTPGPIAINSATFVGQKMAGLAGAIVCTAGCVLPSFLIVLALAWAYTKYRKLSLMQSILKSLRPAVVAMIAGAALTILLMAFFGTSTLGEIDPAGIRWIEVLLFLVSLFLLRKKKAGPITIIFGTAVAGTLLYLLF